MAVALAALTPTTYLSNAAASIYTCPSNQQASVKRAVFTNRDTSAHTITVHRVPSGGSVQNSNMIISARRLTPGESYVAPELASMVLNAGDAIYAFADANTSVTVTMSGLTA